MNDTKTPPSKPSGADSTHPDSGNGLGLVAAAIAILLWASLAAVVSRLSTLPPFFLTGVALGLGALVCLPRWRDWRVPWSTLLLASGALFAYHALLFFALRLAPPVTANLVNYLWPLFIVLLSPLFDRRRTLSARFLLAALLGFSGAAVAILARSSAAAGDGAVLGYGLAFLAALTWAGYSQSLRRLPAFSSWAVGGFSLLAAAASLLLHLLIEPAATVTATDWPWLLLLGLGPMGLAFVCWDVAMKRADPRHVGVLAYLTPVLSTVLLLWATGESGSVSVLLALVLVVAAAVLVMAPTGRSKRESS